MGSQLVLDAVRVEVADARTAKEAVEAIARALPEELSVSRVAVRLRRPAWDDVMVAAVWSMGPTAMGPGGVQPSTGAVGEVYDELVRSRRVRILKMGDGVVPLMEQLLLKEGNSSAVQIPLIFEGKAVGVLSILSSASTAFGAGDLPFYESLGAAVAPHLIPLAVAAIQDFSADPPPSG